MNRFRRLFLFLILNILVSACTTLGVLVLWDSTRGPMPKGVLSSLLENWRSPVPSSASQATQLSTPDAPPTEACIPYQAQQGDSFDSLAQRYTVSAAELRSANGFSQDQALNPGDLICIPVNPKGTVVIESVIGAGDLETEHIQLKYEGEGELSLAGWRIEDGRGNILIFPQSSQYVLFGGGAVYIYTRSGVNNVAELYWGMEKPVWLSGATVTLRDAQGSIRATYVMP